MKYLLAALVFVFLQTTACKKNDDNCPMVTITNSASGCGGWGIVVSGVKYPSANIPPAFQQNGIFVCADYELYEDMRMCACCGGTWANIKAIKYVGD